MESDYQPSAAVITASYRGHVDAQINDQYHTLSGSLRFLNNIVRFPGCGVFDSESSFVALDRKTKTMIGLILCSRVRSDVGHVTQVCVLPNTARTASVKHYLARLRRIFASEASRRFLSP